MRAMDTYECVATKLDVREFDSRDVPADVKLKILEAARLTASGLNYQHWSFILIQDQSGIKRLAEDSTTGKWVAKANFATIILTNPKYPFHLIDAGRVLQDMQLTAWNYGVVSGIYTGVKGEDLCRHFNIPDELSPSVVVGFGYPARKITGKRKNRKPLTEVAFLEKYGNRLDTQKL
jgi:nitroreductase